MRVPSLNASIYCGARDITDFSDLLRFVAHRQKSFVQIKDRLRYSALPLNPARKLCSCSARGRALLQLAQTSRTVSILSTSAPLVFFRLTYLIRALGSWQVRRVAW